ncbi:phage tail tape measure protein [Paenibacillus sp. FSL W8-0186]|uniref:phage tail tape measure protein n=1 Tax=Paenibacillus sp. FSL W8-0186 TaxID=2921709 RepID=UPI0030CF7ACD
MANDTKILITADININLSIAALNKAIKDIEKHPSLKKIKITIEIDKQENDKVGKSFGQALKSVYKQTHAFIKNNKALLKQGMQDIIKTILEVDTQITQLKRVMNEGTDFESMLRGSIQTANELGHSISEVNNLMIKIGRMGFDEQQTLALTKTATLFQNISELTPDQAIQTMTAAMSAFNIEAEDSILIADRLNAVDNKFSVTSQDLASSLTQAGTAASNYGISMEKLIGDTTAISMATRESGEVIGKLVAA